MPQQRHSCNLGEGKIIPDNGLSMHPDFETGVATIPQEVAYEKQMTNAEKQACKFLLKSTFTDGSSNDRSVSGSSVSDLD